MIKIIGIIGVAEAGKSTLARSIASFATSKCHLYPIAYPLKFGLKCMGVTKEHAPEMYRKAAQTVGQLFRDPEFAKGSGPEWWAELARQMFCEMQSRSKDDEWLVIVDDVRFKEEIEVISKFPHVFVHLDAVDRLWSKIESEQWRTDESEVLAQALSLQHDYWGLHLPSRCSTIDNNEQLELDAVAKYFGEQAREVLEQAGCKIKEANLKLVGAGTNEQEQIKDGAD